MIINDAIIDKIADEVKKQLIAKEINQSRNNGNNTIPVGVSNRHIHLTEQTFKRLFGVNTEFEVMRPLYQPGEFASKHVLTVVGPKQRAIQGIRILGPLRKYDQVEISLSDAILLGIYPPVINSGT